jgi:hypothetical protein
MVMQTCLVVVRCSWLTGPIKEPTKEGEARVESLTAEMDEAWSEFKKYRETAKTKEAQKELSATETYRTLLSKYHELRAKRYKLKANSIEHGDFIWLFRRK